jgi:subtilisin
MRRPTAVFCALAAVCACTQPTAADRPQPAASPLAASSDGPHAGSPASARATSDGRYIVVLADGADAEQIALDHERRFGVDPIFVYRHALDGYAAYVDPTEAWALELEPAVLFVEPDSDGRPAPAGRSARGQRPRQALALGLNRIDAELSSTVSGDGRGSVDVNVAVLDTGVQPDHKDLVVVDGVNCVGPNRDAFGDPSGHGTMVAGFIGALDNRLGRVGVAPGARISAVRVLDAEGFGFTSEVLCGIDWVAGTRVDGERGNDVAVANMSFGGAYPDDGACGLVAHAAMHHAICSLTRSGVTVVAAAGNNGVDFQVEGPPTFAEVLAVTAIADRDGRPGGLTPGEWRCDPQEASADDAAAEWSNVATLSEDRAHVVAAPGVCVGSTSVGNQYAVSSGTSFASPIVAGTVALCIASGPCAGLAPAQIIDKIVADAEAYNLANPEYGFDGDPLRPAEGRYFGYLLNAAIY